MTEVARTLSLSSTVATPAALSLLEFPRVLDVVARHAVGPLGADAMRARRPSADVAWIREELAAAREMAGVLDGEHHFEPEPVPDLAPALEALDVPGTVLEVAELVQLGRAVEAMHAVGRSLRALAGEAPRVAGLAVEPPPTDVARAVTRAIDADGEIKDDASGELKRARRLVRETRERLVQLLDATMRDLGPEAGAGEVTLRDGRYVIPLRREAARRVAGLIHGESASGATLYVEPTAAVELGNRLVDARAAEARAVQAVLRDLTERARPHRAAIEAGWRMCIAADDLYARARYMRAMGASVPEMADAPGNLAIVGGVHPLLGEVGEVGELGAASRASPTTAVPFSLSVSRTLVVSGPNAGGKTVLLKAVGVVALLAQSGIVPPVGRGTRLPVFRRIFVDIGDHQSIAASLSTFSARVATLRDVLASADSGSLVLLDELGGGTDPVEGAALAAAVLLALHERRATTLATTHLNQLKELASEVDGVENASLEFDADTLSPTYRLIQGRPGRSYGLAIARRLGLPEDVLAVATDRVPAAQRQLDATLAALERREQALAAREADLTRREAAASRREAELEAALTGVEQRERQVEQRAMELERAGREQARKFLLDARRRVEDALSVARAAVNEATAREARRLVEEGVREEASHLERLEALAKAKGWKVQGGGNPRVAPERRQAAAPGAKQRRADEWVDTVPAPSARDLRGLRADEAELRVTQAVDAAVVAGLPWLRIIHGKGTGALRHVVDEVLRRDRRVARHHLAPPEQGGSGVTIVEFGA